MAKRVTRWRPDTCGCIIDYEWDDSQPESSRQHTGKKMVNRCKAHKNHSDADECFQALHQENSSKNMVLCAILEKLPAEDKKEITDAAGAKTEWFKTEPSFSFNQDRELQIELAPGLKKETLDEIKNHVASLFESTCHIS